MTAIPNPVVDRETKETLRFLVGRIAGDAGNNGLSSDALIVAVMRGTEPSHAPLDLSDFGRCCEAFALAPWVLKLRMLPHLAKWCDEMIAKYAERSEERASTAPGVPGSPTAPLPEASANNADAPCGGAEALPCGHQFAAMVYGDDSSWCGACADEALRNDAGGRLL